MTTTNAAGTTALVPVEVDLNPLAVAPAALELMERAQIDMQIATAKRYPRPEILKIRQRMLTLATVDEETAESCIYTLRRRDKDSGEQKLIQGPSVRLAEILVNCWGNIRAGARTIDNDGRKVTAQGVCFDLESNVTMVAEVSRKITDRNGRPYSEDMQIMTAGAAQAIARRNAVLQVVPFALIKPVYEEIKKVVTGNASTLAVKRDKLFKRFYSMGVDKEQILGVLGKENVESVDLEDLALLVGLGTAIKDHEMTIEEAFSRDQDDAKEEIRPRTRLREKLEARRAAKKAAEPPAGPKEGEEQ